MIYPFAKIEAKWQEKWEEDKVFQAKIDKSKPKFYALDMFPYPSSNGLHVGHPEGYTASDIVSRYKRARGFNVLHPMGWDAFGLPAEQYAIKTGIHPEETTRESIITFTRQLKSLGFSYDWSREIATCDPKYYKWTQFIFLKLYEKGLAYQKEVPVNWCPALKTVLANDEVVDGKSERGGHPVEKRPMVQWMLKITEYADRLLDDLETVDWPEATKKRQRDWIGKSYGAQVHFPLKGHEESLEIFTTRPDTIYGATFMVLAPEHALVDQVTTEEYRDKVKSYQKATAGKSDIDRQADTTKTGEFTGAYAINPVNGEEIPVWIADYVLMGYGTGAIMAVPGHDERDYEFAQKFEIPVVMVIEGGEAPHSGEGPCINSEVINGLEKTEAIAKITKHLEEKGVGKAQIQYRLRDWLFSRQRYWGEPFPVVHFPESGMKAISSDELPLLLPPIDSYEPSDSGEAPLARASEDWLKVEKNGEVGTRNTDTMPGAAGSSWYFLRYTDPHNEEEPFSFEAQDYWMPVDLYIGGPEHAVGHLLYSRFWQKVLFDAGLTSGTEPFQKLVHQGMILGEDNQKMSKSKGNVINPDDMVSQFGADSFRMYEMFMGPLDKDKPWATNGLIGVSKFLNKFWNLIHDEENNILVDDSELSKEIMQLTHRTIKKVTDDIESMAFNTAVSQMMIFVNEMNKSGCRSSRAIKPVIQCLAPFAPHFAEEIWEKLGESSYISVAPWPEYNPELIQSDEVKIAVQIKGKTRGIITVEMDSPQEAVEEKARSEEFFARNVGDKEIRKVIFVPNKIINYII